ncbi:MAG: cytochrome c peroxidase [Bacteroidota bacterium]
MKKTNLLFVLLAILLINACKNDDDTGGDDLDAQLEEALLLASNGQGKAHFILPASTDYNSIPQDPLNPITSDKVNLGQLLYHETGIALAPKDDLGLGTFSCASCHFASAGFQAGRVQGIADGGVGFGVNGEGRERDMNYPTDSLDVQPIKSPSTLNTAYQQVMLWNGMFGATGPNAGTEAFWTPGTPKETNNLGYEGVETQAIAGLTVHRLVMEESFLEDKGYKELFDKAFPNVDETERYTREFAGLAIAAYERTLFPSEAPFQKWLKGDMSAMTDQEKRGALVFFDVAKCGNCHNGPALSSMEFHAIGMNDLYECPEEIFQASASSGANLGRGDFTGDEEDMYKFKVPQLYNLGDSPFYGHGSSFRSIADVVEYKNAAIAQNAVVPSSQLAEDFQPLGLNQSEIDDIVAFIQTGLQDDNLDRYVPNAILSGNCFPNNDPMAQSDLGCN